MDEDLFAMLRDELIVEIVAETAMLGEQLGKDAFDERVIEVIARVPRHEFVPLELKPYAYLNRPLPIGYDKTISQPFIVALMTDLLELREDDVVLEIGTGLGYQSAILSRLARRIYTIEVVEELAVQARQRLAHMGCTNVEVKIGNGARGWPAHAPFDKIIVTAAPDLIPPALIMQLKAGGRMVIPAGLADSQQLLLVTKDEHGKIATREVLPVRFSELEGDEPTAFA